MLECTLDFSDVICASSYIDFWVLWVLNRKFVTRTLIIAFPTTASLGEIKAIFTDGDSNILIIELDTIKLKKVDQMLSKVHLFSRSTTKFVFSLKVTRGHHC